MGIFQSVFPGRAKARTDTGRKMGEVDTGALEVQKDTWLVIDGMMELPGWKILKTYFDARRESLIAQLTNSEPNAKLAEVQGGLKELDKLFRFLEGLKGQGEEAMQKLKAAEEAKQP